MHCISQKYWPFCSTYTFSMAIYFLKNHQIWQNFAKKSERIATHFLHDATSKKPGFVVPANCHHIEPLTEKALQH